MNLIPPSEIAGRVMTLIQDAEKELIIVSPYVNIAKWGNMKRSLQKAVERGVDIKFIVRLNAEQDLSELIQVGITPIFVQDLHAKLYINEKSGIVTSQNVTQYSDTNSIDIAYVTQTYKERNELIDFVDKYITEIKAKTAARSSTGKFEERSHFINVPEFNYEDKKIFDDYQIDRLHEAFMNHYRNSYFRRASGYVFSDNLFPFADIMVDSRLVIKISKGLNDCIEILNKMESIAYKGNHTFRIELRTTHPKFYYLEFIPVTAIAFQKLIDDYISLTSKILDVTIPKKYYSKPGW